MRSWLAALAATAMLAALPTLAQADGPPVPQLQANGTGEVMVVPDIAIVTIGVATQAADASAALAANSADLARAIAAIQAAGIADKDIATAGFSIDPVYRQGDNQPSDEPPAIVGYRVDNQVRVTVRDVARSGGLLDKVVAAGANRVSGIAFDLSDRKTPADGAIRAAIADARAKAELMADAAGLRLVRILSLNAGETGGRGPIMAYDMAAKAAPVPVMPGERSVSANAQIAWEVAPK
jgi:uncharacterized protein YggE